MRYVVRIWVDVVVHADSPLEAKKLVRRLPAMNFSAPIDEKRFGLVERYDEQVADVWEKEER